MSYRDPAASRYDGPGARNAAGRGCLGAGLFALAGGVAFYLVANAFDDPSAPGLAAADVPAASAWFVALTTVAGALLGRLAVAVAGGGNITLFVVIGVAAFLGAGYRVPLAAVMFVAETTGRPQFVVPGLLAAVAAALVMGRASVTTYQRASTQAEPPTPARE